MLGFSTHGDVHETAVGEFGVTAHHPSSFYTMITDLLMSVLPEGELEEVFHFSDQEYRDEITDIDFLDYLYEVQLMEFRPRIYKGDFGERLWCVEIYDWSKKTDNHVKTLVGFPTRKESVYMSLIWYYQEYSVKNS